MQTATQSPPVAPATGIHPVEKLFALQICSGRRKGDFLMTMFVDGSVLSSAELEAAFPFTESTVQIYQRQLLEFGGASTTPVEICA